MISVTDTAALRAAIGEEIGVSDWRTINQTDVDAFAALTGDDQWIHVDPERSRSGPFGGTIVHGLLTLGLGPRFLYDLLDWSKASSSVNYGFDKVRMPAPLPTGSSVRMRLGIMAVDDVGAGHQITFLETFECQGAAKPVCVAQFVARVYP